MIFGDVTVPEKGFCSSGKRQEAERTGVSTLGASGRPQDARSTPEDEAGGPATEARGLMLLRAWGLGAASLSVAESECGGRCVGLTSLPGSLLHPPIPRSLLGG